MRKRQSSVTRETQYPVRSSGAAARGATGAGRAPPRPWAGMDTGTISARAASQAAAGILPFIDALASLLLERTAPLPAVGWAGNIHHAEAVVGGVAAGIGDYTNVTARFQGFAGDALPAQLAAGAPFHGPSLRFPLVVRALNVHERMRI